MRTIKNIFFLLCCLSLAGIMGNSCKKDSAPNYGIPTITRVAQPLDTTDITSGNFSQWVIIYGSNLASTQAVSFNDQTVAYKTIYSSDTSVTVQIPRAIPTKNTNTITIVTKGGTATFQFTTLIPSVTLNDMVNEYTAPGDTLVLTGQNFDLLDAASTTVTFTGGSKVTEIYGTTTQLKVRVPSDAQPGPVTLTSTKPLNITLTTTGWYHDNRNFLVDMSNLSLDYGPAFLSSGPDPAPINGPYFKVAKQWQGSWNWDPFFAGNVAIPAELVNAPSQYVNYGVKFEMNIPVGPPSMPLQLYLAFNGGDFRENFFDVSGNNTYPFNTGGQWQTFTAPLSTWSSGLATYVFTNPVYFDLMLKDVNPSQSNFSICNLRLVRIK